MQEPHELTPRERLTELSRLFASGVIRIFELRRSTGSSQTCAESSPTSLDVSCERSLNVSDS